MFSLAVNNMYLLLSQPDLLALLRYSDEASEKIVQNTFLVNVYEKYVLLSKPEIPQQP